MAKKTTTTKTTATAAPKTAQSATKTNKATAPVQPAAAKPKPAAKAPVAKAAPAKLPAAQKSTPKPIVRAGFSNDDVALRAYFIAENRQAAGRSGDTHSDWVEAERQLRSEHGSVA